MQKKLVIAVDVDDVMIETSSLLIAYYNKTYGTNVGLENMYPNDLHPWGVSDKAAWVTRVETYLATEEFRSVPPSRETVEALECLARSNELHAVTGRSTALELVTNDVVSTRFRNIFQSVVFTGLLDKKRGKAEVCRELDVDVLIDDHLGHALPVARCGIEVLLFGDYPWNQADKLPANVHRVKDWAAVLQYFDEQG
jgi:uncharacterized HAD superfamily protein